MYIMIISCVLPFVGMLVMSLLPDTTEYKWVKWGMYNMTVVFSLAIFLGWSLSGFFCPPHSTTLALLRRHFSVTSNIAGGTKRTVVSSLTLISYCVGNMVGTQVFRTTDAPRYVHGTIACSACFGLEIICIVLWRLWYMRENKRRDRQAAESGLTTEEQELQGLQMGVHDVTDLKNPHFRYAM
jgi:MFS transporter, ACS family, allantoate permease